MVRCFRKVIAKFSTKYKKVGRNSLRFFCNHCIKNMKQYSFCSFILFFNWFMFRKFLQKSNYKHYELGGGAGRWVEGSPKSYTWKQGRRGPKPRVECVSTSPVDTGRKLNVHKTFKKRPGRLLSVLCTFNLRPVSTGFMGDFSFLSNVFL